MNWMNADLKVITEEAVDFKRAVGVGGVDSAEDVEVDTMLLETAPAADDPLEAALPASADPVGVVHFLGAVHAEADEELMLLEEGAPFVVQHGAVGLHGVGDMLAPLPVLLGVFD